MKGIAQIARGSLPMRPNDVPARKRTSVNSRAKRLHQKHKVARHCQFVIYEVTLAALMASLRHFFHEAYKSAAEKVLPPLSESAFKEKGVR